MAHECLSRLQRRILTWLVAEDQRTRGTMVANSTADDAERRPILAGDRQSLK